MSTSLATVQVLMTSLVLFSYITTCDLHTSLFIFCNIIILLLQTSLHIEINCIEYKTCATKKKTQIDETYIPSYLPLHGE